MTNTQERKNETAEKEREMESAEELELSNEEREEVHREDDRDQREDLNQGFWTGTHDSIRRGVRWPPSYRVRRRVHRAEQAREPETKESK